MVKLVYHFVVITDSDVKTGISSVEIEGPFHVSSVGKTPPSYVDGVRTGDIITVYTYYGSYRKRTQIV